MLFTRIPHTRGFHTNDQYEDKPYDQPVPVEKGVLSQDNGGMPRCCEIQSGLEQRNLRLLLGSRKPNSCQCPSGASPWTDSSRD